MTSGDSLSSSFQASDVKQASDEGDTQSALLSIDNDPMEDAEFSSDASSSTAQDYGEVAAVLQLPVDAGRGALARDALRRREDAQVVEDGAHTASREMGAGSSNISQSNGGDGSSSESQSTSGRSSVDQLCRVAYSFAGSAEDATQLSLKQGDLVRVQCRDASGWTYGRLEVLSSQYNADRINSIGSVGWLPQALLEDLPQEEEERDHGERTVPRDRFKRSTPAPDDGASTLNSCQLSKSSILYPEASPEETDKESIKLTDDVFKVQPADNAPPSTLSLQVQGTRSATIMGIGTSEADEQPRHANTENRKLRQCEQRLLNTANSRRRCLGAFESASHGTSEAEEAVETALRALQNLEEQEQRRRIEASCVAGSASKSMHQTAMMKLRLVETKKRDALAILEHAQERLEAERRAQNSLRAQLRSENQAAAAALEALSVQRARANRRLRSTLHSNSWTSSEPLPDAVTVAAEPSDRTHKRSALQNQSSKKQQPETSRKVGDSQTQGSHSQKVCLGDSSLTSPEGLTAVEASLARSRPGLKTRGAPPPRIRPGLNPATTPSLRSRSASREPASQQGAGARSRTASQESMLRSSSMQSLVEKSRSLSRETPQRGGAVTGGAPPPSTAQLNLARTTKGRASSQDGPRRPRSLSNQRSPSTTSPKKHPDVRNPALGTSGRAPDPRRYEQNEIRNKLAASSPPSFPDANKKEARSLVEVVQAAQALQEKLSGMPEHLRRPISKIVSRPKGRFSTNF